MMVSVMLLSEFAANAISLGINMIVSLGITIACFVGCYTIAKNNNMSGYYTLLGFFGVIGVLAVLIISMSVTNNNTGINQNNYNGQNGYNNQNNYNGQNGYNNQNIYNGQNGYNNQNMHNGQNGYNNQNTYNGNDSYYENQTQSKFKYCPKCGAKIEALASFCSYCGKEFNS